MRSHVHVGATRNTVQIRHPPKLFFSLFLLPLHPHHYLGEEEGLKTRLYAPNIKSLYISVSMSSTKTDPVLGRAANGFTPINGGPVSASSPLFKGDHEKMAPAALPDAILELGDGSTYRGIGFGAEGKSVAGECVFQTG